jgi:hypothetical protein
VLQLGDVDVGVQEHLSVKYAPSASSCAFERSMGRVTSFPLKIYLFEADFERKRRSSICSYARVSDCSLPPGVASGLLLQGLFSQLSCLLSGVHRCKSHCHAIQCTHGHGYLVHDTDVKSH